MPTRAELTRDLALKIVDIAETESAEASVFFSALAMAFLSSFIGHRTNAGHDVEEADLAQAIEKFKDTLCQQASWLMGVQPQVLKAEIEQIEPESAPSKGVIILP